MKNKYRHKWVDIQQEKTGVASYVHTCKKCGCIRYKQDLVSYKHKKESSDD